MRKHVAKALIALSILITAGDGSSQSSGGLYEQPRFTIDQGGGRSEGGVYAMTSSIAQPDAVSRLSGGQYAVAGGFWGGVRGLGLVFVDSFEQDNDDE